MMPRVTLAPEPLKAADLEFAAGLAAKGIPVEDSPQGKRGRMAKADMHPTSPPGFDHDSSKGRKLSRKGFDY